MKRRIVILGATGVFGERLARRLATWQDVSLVLAARSAGPLYQLAAELGATALPMSRDAPALDQAFAVVDCAGPFQGADYGFATRALEAGVHYIDIADGRDFVAGFPAALHQLAKSRGLAAITGASSTPALSQAALDALTEGWSRIDRISSGISPGARAPKGLAVVRAILSWAGQPVHVFEDGASTTRPGWGLLRRADFPGLGRRWLALADTPDLDLLVARYRPTRSALFLAGLESPVLHLGLWLASRLVRLKLLRSLAPLARPMRRLAQALSVVGSDRGGMIVRAEGRDAQDRPIRGQWALAAPAGLGPHVPTLAAQAVLRALMADKIEHGARVAAGVVSLGAIINEADGLGLQTEIAKAWPADSRLFARLLGPAFDQMPAAVRQVHGSTGLWRGQARARGARGLARIARAVAGIRTGRFSDFSVSITTAVGGEIWRRQFGPSAFQSLLRDRPDETGVFEEALGPLRFALRARPRGPGFDWLPIGWRLGPLPLPTVVMPRIRARSFQRDGAYRFRVRISHPLCGLIVAYAGSLETPPSVGDP